MKKSKSLFFVLLAALVGYGTYVYCFSQFAGQLVPTSSTTVQPKPILTSQPGAARIASGNKIQVALLLDTSSSMNGLIEQAKSQLWKMVNDLAGSTKEGETPNIEIALYEYGNDNLSARSGYIRQISVLTTDLDAISEALFALTTRGGEEYCAWVGKSALNDLQWTDSTNDFKVMFIAGNEPFTQGPVPVRQLCELAKQKGVVVNTIHCGDYQKGIRDGWKDGAICTGGEYMNINMDSEVVHVATPYDDKVMELNQKLNDTYLSFGSSGLAKKENMATQDFNANTYSAANSRTRAFFKSKKSYDNSSWDLVDASADKEVSEVLEEVEEESLPEEMKGMTDKERQDYVEKKKTERENIRQELLEYEKKTKEYIAEKRKEMSETETLDNAMLKTLRKQAESKAYKFEN